MNVTKNYQEFMVKTNPTENKTYKAIDDFYSLYLTLPLSLVDRMSDILVKIKYGKDIKSKEINSMIIDLEFGKMYSMDKVEINNIEILLSKLKGLMNYN